MTWEAWLTLTVVTALVATLLSERAAPPVAMGAAVVVLYLAGVTEFSEAFAGLSNPAPITVAALYVVAGAAEQTGALSRALSWLLSARPPGGERQAVLRVSGVAAAGSALVPNTPLVALLVPSVEHWGRRNRISPSRLLMPLSFAAVLGGVVTVLGTSTNLVVNGFLDATGNEPLGIFEITPVGLPVAVVGVVVLCAATPLLLPRRSTPTDEHVGVREYTIELVVTAASPLRGRSLAESGLSQLDGVTLAEIDRLGQIISPVAAEQVLEAGDHLMMLGSIERISDLKHLEGLVTAHEELVAGGVGADLGHMFEAVVSGTGPLAGRTLKELEFAQRHGAAVIAVHRAGERVSGALGDLHLRGGDVLVLVAADGFRERTRDLSDFLLVAPMEAAAPSRRPGGRIVQLVVLALILASASGITDLTTASVAAAFTLVAVRVVTPSEARRAVNFDVIAMVALSFGLGAAVSTSGLAETVAGRLVSLSEPFGDLGTLMAVMAATVVLTEVLTNNAAAALMFPVALAVSTETGVDLRALAVGILVMASCSFLSPIGYQTNTMVWSIGGYRFSDFTRLGVPLTLAAFASATLLIPLVFPLSP